MGTPLRLKTFPDYPESLAHTMPVVRRLAVLLGVLLFVVLFWRLGPSSVLALAVQIRWYALVVLVLYAAHDCTRALALQGCVLRPGLLRFGDAFAIRLSGDAVESLTFTGPLLAEPTRAWLLERRGLTLTEGFAATITEDLICTFVGAAMSIAALLLLVHYFHPAPAFARTALAVACALGVFLGVAAVAIWRRLFLIGAIVSRLARAGVLRGRLRPEIAAVNRMEELLLITLHDQPRRFALVASYEAASQVCLVLELFTLMRAVAQVGLFDAFVVEGAIKMIGTIFLFVPLQIGVAEGTYVALFRVMGLSAAAGFAVVLLRRARSLAAGGIGLAVLAYLSWKRRSQSG